MDQFQDDDEEQDGEKKGRFKNSKNTGDINKFKRDKNAPQVSKVEDKEKKVDKVFKPVGKATLGAKWGNDEVDNDKQLAMEKLKLLEEQVQDNEPKQTKKEPKFVGKAIINEKSKEFDAAEKERQRLAQEKLKQIEASLPNTNVKIELVKDEPKQKRFTNSKKEVDNGLKKKTDEKEKVAKVVKPVVKQQEEVKNTGTTTASRW